VCARLDGQLQSMARKYRLIYSRFADDLTFSTYLKAFPEDIAKLTDHPPAASAGPVLIELLRSNGFQINERKSRLQKRNERQEVTGLVVSRFPNVPRKLVRRVRAMLHAWEVFGHEAAQNDFSKFDKRHRAPWNKAPKFRNVVGGYIAYLTMVRGKADPIVMALRARYKSLDPSFGALEERSLHERAMECMWVLECENEMVQGTCFSMEGVGLVTCDHVLGTATHAFRPAAPGIKFPATVVIRSKSLDLAVLSLDSPIGPALVLDKDYRPKVGDQVNVLGFPNYQVGDSGYFISQRIAGLRPASGVLRALVDGPIAAGMSGGPVLDSEAKVIGVIVSGAENLSQANMTERHGFVPSHVLTKLLKENGLIA
jgi:RNA-directed DNA polymerase